MLLLLYRTLIQQDRVAKRELAEIEAQAKATRLGPEGRQALFRSYFLPEKLAE